MDRFESLCRMITDEFKLPLSDKSKEELKKWVDNKKDKVVKQDAIGARFTYEITPCSLGTFIVIKDNAMGDSIDLSDCENW